MSCDWRIGSRTVREVEIANPAVVFRGPSPEHDISVLTGLRAARLPVEAGADPLVLRWSKKGGDGWLVRNGRGPCRRE